MTCGFPRFARNDGQAVLGGDVEECGDGDGGLGGFVVEAGGILLGGLCLAVAGIER